MGKKTEAEKNIERQNIKNAYEPNIKAMRSQRDDFVSEIEHLTMQKIFLDSNVQTMNEDYLEFKKVIDNAALNYSKYDELQGNYMDYVTNETEAIIGHGEVCLAKLNHAGMVADIAQNTLNKKIEDLRSDLTDLLRELSDTQIQFQNALNLII